MQLDAEDYACTTCTCNICVTSMFMIETMRYLPSIHHKALQTVDVATQGLASRHAISAGNILVFSLTQSVQLVNYEAP